MPRVSLEYKLLEDELDGDIIPSVVITCHSTKTMIAHLVQFNGRSGAEAGDDCVGIFRDLGHARLITKSAQEFA